MPVTIQPASMKIKNGNTFTAVDCLKGDDVDVQINGTSITSNGVANVPLAGNGNGVLGVVSVDANYGIGNNVNGRIFVQKASSANVKAGSVDFKPVVPLTQHESVFYGLSKLAGVDLANETVTVGTYPESSKTAIRNMLGVSTGVVLTEHVPGTTPEITCQPNVRYYCDEVSTITITPPAMGTCDVFFGSGYTPAVLSVAGPSGYVMFPAWFDYENLESNCFYEIMITDGSFGSVMIWRALNSDIK